MGIAEHPALLPADALRGTDTETADLVEVDAAIELVRRGTAVRVRLVGLHAPEWVAGVALAHAQAAGIELVLDRSGTSPGLTVGPRR